MKDKVKAFLKAAFWPGGKSVNLNACMVLGGFGLLALISVGKSAWGWGPLDPNIIEMGKAAFYVGLGRASNNRN